MRACVTPGGTGSSGTNPPPFPKKAEKRKNEIQRVWVCRAMKFLFMIKHVMTIRIKKTMT